MGEALLSLPNPNFEVFENNISDDSALRPGFKDQLRRNKYGWYKTGLMWKDNSTAL